MEAESQYKTGVEQKAQGLYDTALTSFRRAVISDPTHFPSQLEIGFICWDKAKLDKMFLRYAFEAFRNAARLNLEHEQAHTYYITVAQKMGLLEDLME